MRSFLVSRLVCSLASRFSPRFFARFSVVAVSSFVCRLSPRLFLRLWFVAGRSIFLLPPRLFGCRVRLFVSRLLLRSLARLSFVAVRSSVCRLLPHVVVVHSFICRRIRSFGTQGCARLC